MIRKNITLILVLTAAFSLGCRARFDAVGVQSTALEAGDGDAKGSGDSQPPAPPPEDIPQDVLEVLEFSEEFKVSGINREIDVIFAIDTSGSMKQEVAALETNMAGFLQTLVDRKFDANVIVISGVRSPGKLEFNVQLPPNLADHYAHVEKYIHSTDAIGHLNLFFDGQYDNDYDVGDKDFLRPNSRIETVIVSDDNGSNTNNVLNVTNNLANQFVGLDGRDLRVHGIVGIENVSDESDPECKIANYGTEHIALANDTTGLVLDICSKDWNALAMKLADDIVIAANTYELAYVPAPGYEDRIFVKIDGTLLSPDDYEITENQLTINVDVAVDQTINIGYLRPNPDL